MGCKVGLLFVLLGVLSYAQANMISNGISCDEKKTIIDTHNDLRTKLANGQVEGQPKAGDLQKMVWDDQLATLAQNYANKMKFEHNPHRKDPRWQVGENIFTQWGSSPDGTSTWDAAVLDWFGEHKDYTYKPMNSDPKTGHYTQVAWSDSTHVGCGYSFYKQKGAYHKLYVCNYGPAGNWLGKYPYTTGAGCEDLCCEDQCSSMYGQQC